MSPIQEPMQTKTESHCKGVVSGVLPNFLMIGAAKCGTTSLAYYLSQHPQIFISPIKEPRYFAPEFYTTGQTRFLKSDERKSPYTLEEYQQLFQGVKDEVAIGEASTEYLYFPETPHKVKKLIPHAKLIAILRHPVERAFSSYCYHVQDAREDRTFAQAIAEESWRMTQNWRPGWLYLQSGYYYQQLKRYFDIFDPSQIRVYFQENLDQNPQSVLEDIFSFLNVSTDFKPELKRQNISSFPKNRYLNALMTTNNPLKLTLKALLPGGLSKDLATRIRTRNMAAKPQLDPVLRQQLLTVYREDIAQLEKLLHKDLSQWKI